MYNYNILKDLLGDGIFAVDGEKWRKQRKVSSHEFSTRVLRDFSSVIFRQNAVKVAHIMSEIATTTKTIDIQVSLQNSMSVFNEKVPIVVGLNNRIIVQDLFMKATLDSIFKVAFGAELNSMCGSNEEGKNFSNAFDNASEITVWRYVDVFWKIKKFLNIGSEAAMKQNTKTVNDFVYKLISNKINRMQSSRDDSSVSDLVMSFCF